MSNMDIAEFTSDYVTMLREAEGKRVTPKDRKKLAKEIQQALLDYDVKASTDEIEYYLP